MPRVNGKEFPYTAAGKAAAAAYRKLSKSKSDDDWEQQQKNQKPITPEEILKRNMKPEVGETQAEFVKGMLGVLDEGERGLLNPSNSTIARKVLVDIYRK